MFGENVIFKKHFTVPLASPECTTDSECPSSKICANQYCQDPCQISKPCDPTAECTTINHRPICNCPNGWAGNPQTQCYKRTIYFSKIWHQKLNYQIHFFQPVVKLIVIVFMIKHVSTATV